MSLVALLPSCDGGSVHTSDAGGDSASAAHADLGPTVDADSADAPAPPVPPSPPGPPAPPPPAGTCPWGATLSANAAVGLAAIAHSDGVSPEEQQLLDRMNAHRGGELLVWSPCLADLARSHSADMVAAGYYGHGAAGAPDDFMVSRRATAAGLVVDGRLDENVLTGDLRYWLGGDIARVVDMWMMDDHRLPILGCREVGVGVASMPYLDTTIVYVTADFACP
ncbi:MAG: CAP domain-containing protein [Deltaproteobacteria bacterium]|nr:CAP domain-containing protein [Deltaproteobacteria bacterium]